MFPDRKTALQELAKAEELNPGPWGATFQKCGACGRADCRALR